MLFYIYTPHYKLVLKYFRDDIIKCLDNAIDNHEEGIVVKDPSSIYKPNSRNSGWYKIKPEVRLQSILIFI